MFSILFTMSNKWMMQGSLVRLITSFDGDKIFMFSPADLKTQMIL